ncbi:hypothetical protein K470DRAFT_282923 [Piedraia hortae CBS 480.64]|uniref:LicD/FKTN/FKRP nucleotidyltransferase domain-containing protein n=1 Tax=Piedraia hortae CBS 480.64 TaxID=1314780 RepID=A0A6A7BUY0_9PEZI|nr:hypothetical protein K470DRAFT_282923 [Piedraia hortae CBS 480.64]
MWTALWLLISLLPLYIFGGPLPVKREAPFDEVRTRLDHHYQNQAKDRPDKYFHEAKFHIHYDGRFADRTLDDKARISTLTALVQTYLSTMNDIGVETWIMHGSLLGWFWNKKIMPWDTDIDVMISEKSIHHLADYYNMTVHHFWMPTLNKGCDYLLEVNPHFAIEAADKDNKIDARWIDTDSGLFIDITSIRRNSTADHIDDQGLMVAKDTHQYYYDEIYPLRETMFESFPAKVPYAYADILVDEYGPGALANIQIQSHVYNLLNGRWNHV